METPLLEQLGDGADLVLVGGSGQPLHFFFFFKCGRSKLVRHQARRSQHLPGSEPRCQVEQMLPGNP